MPQCKIIDSYVLVCVEADKTFSWMAGLNTFLDPYYLYLHVLGPQLLSLPLALSFPFNDKTVLPSPCLHGVANVQLFHLVGLDNNNAKVRPCDRIMQILHFLTELVIWVWFLTLGGCSRVRIPPGTYRTYQS